MWLWLLKGTSLRSDQHSWAGSFDAVCTVLGQPDSSPSAWHATSIFTTWGFFLWAKALIYWKTSTKVWIIEQFVTSYWHSWWTYLFDSKKQGLGPCNAEQISVECHRSSWVSILHVFALPSPGGRFNPALVLGPVLEKTDLRSLSLSIRNLASVLPIPQLL